MSHNQELNEVQLSEKQGPIKELQEICMPVGAGLASADFQTQSPHGSRAVSASPELAQQGLASDTEEARRRRARPPVARQKANLDRGDDVQKWRRGERERARRWRAKGGPRGAQSDMSGVQGLALTIRCPEAVTMRPEHFQSLAHRDAAPRPQSGAYLR